MSRHSISLAREQPHRQGPRQHDEGDGVGWATPPGGNGALCSSRDNETRPPMKECSMQQGSPTYG